jgi:redox-sensing transcriptional repressor
VSGPDGVLERRIPEATVARLPVYLQVLLAAGDAEDGPVATLSSDDLARATGFTAAKVRKDLSFLGPQGTRGVGYPVAELAELISRVLGLTTERSVVLVGAGNLGRALASYEGFLRRGFRLAALIDADPAKVGNEVAGHLVEAADELPVIVAARGISIAVLATPATAAQSVADALVAAGITAILNFAPTHLDVPADVQVRSVDLSTELQILSFYDQLAPDRTVPAAG